ncbi:hypothetical protein [Caulobacter hibisci]|uniref:Uncharacterized protein n=1 Tax=Caulobacter hibisci TaxID=2035993 RepID=A0ABS0T002_9CAUL|nr:hypothetical protein [Caulobacter hibisci]MBI1685205.1 hypothetical protein [Caulobacter hibisci]
MITAVRSALICDKVERREGGLTDYLGVHGFKMLADSRPGLFEVWLTLHVDVDKRPTKGQVSVSAADLGLIVPFAFTTERGMSVIAFPIYIPVQAPDTLTVTITDADRRDRPMRFKWSLGFAPGAKVLDAEHGQLVLSEAAKANAKVLASLAKPSLPH